MRVIEEKKNEIKKWKEQNHVPSPSKVGQSREQMSGMFIVRECLSASRYVSSGGKPVPVLNFPVFGNAQETASLPFFV